MFLLANNIFVIFTFKKDINRESFPSKISIKFKTLIENTYLDKCPSTILSNDVTSIESILLTFDSSSYKSFDGNQTIVTYSLTGTTDFGLIIHQISIWHDEFHLNDLSSVQIKDDVRNWNEEYQPSLTRDNEETNNIFEKRDDPTKKCYFFSINELPITNDGHPGRLIFSL